ncbi:MAG: DUF5320 domain-containing protein [Deltaproteobacteria bacterium]|nr:DUF5320 domain-containing protein [Deltaproteobacteria bacterium]
MPRGDGTGPAGFGPITGRGAGYCAGYAIPGFANPIPGRGYGGYGGYGFGFGFRGGRGAGRGGRWSSMPYGWYGASGMPYGAVPTAATVPFTPGPTKQQEMDALKNQADYLAETLEGIKKRMTELEAELAKE